MSAPTPMLKEECENVDALLDGIRRCIFPAAVRYEIEQKGMQNSPPQPELTLMRLAKVRYRERKDIHHAMASLFSALHGTRRRVVFVLTGDGKQCSIYLGFREVADQPAAQAELAAIIKGFLPGTEFEEVQNSLPLTNELLSFRRVHSIIGVPSEKQLVQDEKRMGPMEFGMERLADGMTHDRYALVITADRVAEGDAATYYRQLSSVLDAIHELVKVSRQHTYGTQKNINNQVGENEGRTQTIGNQVGSSDNVTQHPGLFSRWRQGIEAFFLGGKKPDTQHTEQSGRQTSTSESWGSSFTYGMSTGESKSVSETREHINHQALLAEELLKMIQTRLKNGVGEGLWQTGVYMLADNDETAARGCNILKGMWSGAQSHQDPVRSLSLAEVFPKETPCTLPHALALMEKHMLAEHPLGNAYAGGYTWLTSGELAQEANLPYYELPSLASEAMVDYGRYLPSHDSARQLQLGQLIDRNIRTNTAVYMDTDRLNRHLFVTGLTGAGKSNTVRAILLELARMHKPFLVIEPVKSEYRCLKTAVEGMEVFSLAGDNRSTRPSFNPFAFELKEGEDCGTALVFHIDRLKAVFNAALGMYSSMPYILEDIIYKAYANVGWDTASGHNPFYERARHYLGLPEHAELRNLFLPVLADLAGLVDGAIRDFFPDKSDYGVSLVGALKSRLNSLTRGAKGQLLNRRLSLPMSRLLKYPCVIELEKIADNDEKAFIMALLLSRIYEYRMNRRANELEHVLVVEEAHRLLSKPTPTGEHAASSRNKSVEVFTDMLAEIRAYGQGLVIADQIPDKLVPDVIKNTDVKIVHRLMAREDREAVGSAMNLTEEQIKDLNRATPGMATVSFDGLNSAIRVQVTRVDLPAEEADSAAAPIDAMAFCRQNIFLLEEKNEPALPVNRQRALLETHRLFILAAACEDEECGKLLFNFRSELTKKKWQVNCYRAQIEKEELWASMAEGAHELIERLCCAGMSAGEAAELLCALMGFARLWSTEEAYALQLEAFRKRATRDINFNCKADVIRKDGLDWLLQLWLAADENRLRNMEEAAAHCTATNVTPLLQWLEDIQQEMTMGLMAPSEPENAGANQRSLLRLQLRLLRAIPTDDPKLMSLYHILLQQLQLAEQTVHTHLTFEKR